MGESKVKKNRLMLFGSIILLVLLVLWMGFTTYFCVIMHLATKVVAETVLTFRAEGAAMEQRLNEKLEAIEKKPEWWERNGGKK